ncbi:kinesin-like protein Klp61F isoform X2 [Copidosoma floridanum]|uniref:kinesin-like protein Klp61F isoform X2 n=1 Tax=Copidosoma floridanum TaxID=29053 RepID=UPI0006C9D3FE|nr:kinesin-like protein Klp61F isoform X2 [Copidosoma floridanum]
MNDTRNKKDKNQHIQVFVRVRPINNAEKISKSPVVVEVSSNKEIVVKERPQDKLTKKFTFDKVFGPVSKQIDVYNAVVNPLLEEVLAGYNCTVFAYGQTGTGKTFTMEGNCNDPALHWQADSAAGIIPRALSHLFDDLRTLGAQEYSVRVSFLELYNEELFDLLSPNDDASKIRIYEDATRKGAIIIHGLEEVTVHNKSEVYKILDKGSERRQTAATLMNAHSSRSHTVFSITVHIKENTVDGEELLKTGKLNLVDLAGSENVGRSGAVDRRAREAGNINQSLLTLGRVITALVERAPHIPYRESKLTRLLQESLGGRTKTSIIATISPACINIEETLSTLDYAHRAKNITNRPEINQKLSKKALLKEYTEEIERLRRDLLATRERNGVYLAHENFTEMQTQIEIQGKEIEEKINHIKALEETMTNKEKLFSDLQVQFEQTNNALHQTKNSLINTKNELEKTAYDRDVQKHLVEKHVDTEKVLLNQAKTLLTVAEIATNDTQQLHDKISRKQKVETENETVSEQFRNEMLKRFQNVEENLGCYKDHVLDYCSSLQEQVSSVIDYQKERTEVTLKHISVDLVKQEIEISKKLEETASTSYDEYHSWILTQIEKTSDMTQREREALQDISKKISPKIRELVETKISENLKTLHNETSSKLLNLVNNVKLSIDNFCNALLKDRDNLTNEVAEMKKSIEVAVQKQNHISQNEEVLSKMFGDLKNQFENTLKQYENFAAENKQCHSVISDKLNDISTRADNINENNSTSYKRNVKQERHIEKQIEQQISAVKSEVETTLEKNWNIAEHALAQSAVVIDNLEENLKSSQYTLETFDNSVKADAMELQTKAEKEKETILSTAQEYHKVITDASTIHTNFMNDQHTTIRDRCGRISSSLEEQANGASEWHKKINLQLHSTHDKIEKFVSEELRKDIPTGSTPLRRDYSYPRHLVATSPHERIIQRFRQFRKNIESSEDEGENTMVEMTSSSDANSSDSNSLSSPTPIKNDHIFLSSQKFNLIQQLCRR